MSVTQEKASNTPFAWQIHKGDDATPVARSSIAYKSMAAARDAGRRALSGLKAKLIAEERG